MDFKTWLSKWNLEKIKINAKFLEIDLEFKDSDKKAAWELYIELITRTSTQYLMPEVGDEKTALSSIHSLFDTTRNILKKYGPDCINFTQIAVIVLNQVIRPFTSKWHKETFEASFDNAHNIKQFREELQALQTDLRNYTKALSEIIGIEDLTDLEEHL